MPFDKDLDGCLLEQLPCNHILFFPILSFVLAVTTMRTKARVLAAAAACVAGVAEALVSPRSSGPIVDLGYATYQGYYNNTYGLNVWKR